MSALLIVCILTAIIHLTETAAASLRLAGVRTGQVATSLSFVNASLLVTRTSNMLQAPLVGGMVDTAILRGDIQTLAYNFRIILFAAFIGNVIGAILTPFFVTIFTKAIRRFEKVGSVPTLLASIFLPKNFVGIIRNFRLPSGESLKGLSLASLPKTFLVLNVLMVSIYAIGVLSSLYAGAHIPEFRTTASQLSGIVNGIATILLAIMVDPTCAFITDQAVRGKRKESDVRAMVFWIIIGRILGTLLIAQLLFEPATLYIKDATLFVRGMFLR